MPLHVRVELPDRPGALAQITRAFAAAGGDVVSVRVTDRTAGRVVDDFLLTWPPARSSASLEAGLRALPSCRVLGLRLVPTVPDENAVLDLLAHVLRAPGRALETLVDLLPDVAGADWAALVPRAAAAAPVYASAGTPAPHPMLPGDLPNAVAFLHEAGRAVSVPLGERAVVVVRRDGPPFLRREVEEVRRAVDLVAELTETLSVAPRR